jgi:hypothetical protein
MYIRIKHPRSTLLLASLTLALAACGDGGTAVEDWPTYEVRGTVRTKTGQPVPGALVEVHTYGPAGCGEAPFLAYNSGRADDSGRYRVPQDNPTSPLTGCLRILAHPDGSALSTPGPLVDLPIDSARVVEGRTVFTVNLTVP